MAQGNGDTESGRLASRRALAWHRFYKGKIEMLPKCRISGLEDLGVWYTPGVAETCLAIKDDPSQSFELTNRWNYVAVASNGTRVLGLGDVGPLAGYPVMEGKALLYKYLGGVDSTPLIIDTDEPDRFIEAVKMVCPTFGGINLEDIQTPDCFYILNRLRKETDIPVWHDDQQGTSAISLAAIINGLKIVGKKLGEVRITLIGAGAANICLARTLIKAGVAKGHLLVVDSKGILHSQRGDLEANKLRNMDKWELALLTNEDDMEGGIPEALSGADICVSASRPGPGVIKKEWIAGMASDSIVLAEANPIPEIWPEEAKEAGARIVGTGRSDFPNQVNNSVGFPGIFRGVLDVRSRNISDEMHIEAAYAIARTAEEYGLRDDYIVPTMRDFNVFINTAVAVAEKAMEQGHARVKRTRQELRENAESMIRAARSKVDFLMERGIIAQPPE